MTEVDAQSPGEPVRGTLVACPLCDALQTLPVLRPGDVASCRRCHHELSRKPRNGREITLALAVASAILLVIANVTPLMRLSAVGHTTSTTLIGGALEMWRQGQEITGVLIAFCAVIAPAGFIASILIVLLGTRRSSVTTQHGELLRWIHYLRVWSLHEVMMLGILVALVKIAELAQIDVDFGLLAVAGLAVLFPLIGIHLDEHEIWDRLSWAAPAAVAQDAPPGTAE